MKYTGRWKPLSTTEINFLSPEEVLWNRRSACTPSLTTKDFQQAYGNMWTTPGMISAMTVPIPGGALHAIKNIPITAVQKTLGIIIQLDRNCRVKIEYMCQQAQEWVKCLKTRKLPSQFSWLGITIQFWPKVGYGIGGCSASFNVLVNSLRKLHYHLLTLNLDSSPLDPMVLVFPIQVSRPQLLASIFSYNTTGVHPFSVSNLRPHMKLSTWTQTVNSHF